MKYCDDRCSQISQYSQVSTENKMKLKVITAWYVGTTSLYGCNVHKFIFKMKNQSQADAVCFSFHTQVKCSIK